MFQLKYILPTFSVVLFLFGISILVREISRSTAAEEMPERLTTALDPKQLEAIDFIKGKILFTNNCMTCHNLLKPDQDFFIAGLEDGFWTDADKIAGFLQQPQRFSNDPYIIGMMSRFNRTTPHIPFDITNDEVRMIYCYIMIETKRPVF